MCRGRTPQTKRQKWKTSFLPSRLWSWRLLPAAHDSCEFWKLKTIRHIGSAGGNCRNSIESHPAMWKSFIAKCQIRVERTAARRLARRPFVMKKGEPLISFTFDDFPRSALKTAGRILEEHGIFGTYYGSLGLMG